MIGLDTNLVVRVLVEDDAEQARRVRMLLDEAAEHSEPAFISDIVLSELEWVLEDSYDVPRRQIVEALQALVSNERFQFEDRRRVVRAIDLTGSRRDTFSRRPSCTAYSSHRERRIQSKLNSESGEAERSSKR